MKLSKRIAIVIIVIIALFILVYLAFLCVVGYKNIDKKNQEKTCGAIVFDNDKVLIVLDKDGNWEFPKGHVEENESEVQTAIREVKEETNIDIQIDEPKRFVQENKNKKNKKEVVFFEAKKIGGELYVQKEELQDAKWVDMNDVLDVISSKKIKKLYKEVLKSTE